jgi:hypothetical protein
MSAVAENPSHRRLSAISDRVRRQSVSRLEVASLNDETKKKLAEMGYEQELKRSLTMISILGLSFAIIAVPFVQFLQLLFLRKGLSTTFYIGLTDGGPVTILWFNHVIVY